MAIDSFFSCQSTQASGSQSGEQPPWRKQGQRAAARAAGTTAKAAGRVWSQAEPATRPSAVGQAASAAVGETASAAASSARQGETEEADRENFGETASAAASPAAASSAGQARAEEADREEKAAVQTEAGRDSQGRPLRSCQGWLNKACQLGVLVRLERREEAANFAEWMQGQVGNPRPGSWQEKASHLGRLVRQGRLEEAAAYASWMEQHAGQAGQTFRGLLAAVQSGRQLDRW